MIVVSKFTIIIATLTISCKAQIGKSCKDCDATTMANCNKFCDLKGEYSALKCGSGQAGQPYCIGYARGAVTYNCNKDQLDRCAPITKTITAGCLCTGTDSWCLVSADN